MDRTIEMVLIYIRESTPTNCAQRKCNIIVIMFGPWCGRQRDKCSIQQYIVCSWTKQIRYILWVKYCWTCCSQTYILSKIQCQIRRTKSKACGSIAMSPITGVHDYSKQLLLMFGVALHNQTITRFIEEAQRTRHYRSDYFGSDRFKRLIV